MWSGNLKTALASLRVSKWRSFFTMLGIIIGVSSVVSLVSLGEGLKKQVVGQINSLGNDVVSVRSGKVAEGSLAGINLLVYQSSSTLTQTDIDTLNRLPTVSKVVPISYVTTKVKSDDGKSDNAYVLGTTGELPDVFRQKIDFGSFFTTDDGSLNLAVLGSDVARKLFGIANPVGYSVQISGERFIIRGVLAPTAKSLLSVDESGFNSTVFIPPGPANKLAGGHSNILQILAKGKAQGKVDETLQDVRRSLLQSHKGADNFSVFKQQELVNIVGGVVDSATGFISAIAAISLLVGGIGIMNIMLVGVSERIREVGIRKAIGATNQQILNQFLVEGLVLSVLGGIIGILVSLGATLLLRLYTDWEPVISVPILVWAVGVSVAVGIIFSVAPAIKAARKDPIDALRG